MADHLQRVISEDGRFFGLACVTTDVVAEACRRHDTGPAATVALGRALTANLLLAALLKDEQRVRLKFEGNGPLGKIVTEAVCTGKVRGYVTNPHADLPLKNGLIDVAAALGRAGFLTVTKEMGGSNSYQGTVQLCSSEIGEDVAYYLAESEQIPSAIGVGVQVDSSANIVSAGGFLVQTLPPADEALIAALETKVQDLGSVSRIIQQGKTPHDILEALFGEIPHRTLLRQDLCYQCTCSREKMKKVLFTLEKDDLMSLKDERPDGVDVRCEFCGNNYLFDSVALQGVIDSMPDGIH